MPASHHEDFDRLPWRLSPSRASDAKQCLKKFYYNTILGLRAPSTPEQLRGTLTHSALERLFDHPRGERSLEVALSYVEPEWAVLRERDDCAAVLAKGPEAEAEIVEYAKRMVKGYFKMENPNAFDPIGVEMRVAAEVAGVPLHGIIDRMDRVEMPSGAVRWYISDYKTSAKPPDPNSRFLDDKFFGMKVYALVAEEMMGIRVHSIRLIYVAGGSKEAILELGVDDRLQNATRAQLKAIWSGVVRAAKSGEWPARPQKLCNWCDYQPVCPEFHPELAGLEVGDLVGAANEVGVELRTSRT